MLSVDGTIFTVAMALIFNTDLLFPPVSKDFILRGFLPVVMLTASLFSGIYLTFDDITTERVPWVIPILTRNSNYLLIMLCTIALFRWFRDPVHKYFIFVQDRRPRTILYHNQNLNNLDNHVCGGNPLSNQSKALLGYVRQTSASMEAQEMYLDGHDEEGGHGNPMRNERVQRLRRDSS